ncbi:MAG: hypothetical protein GY861_06890 [bacterium]|nr:hypothetical protein [bacterium]
MKNAIIIGSVGVLVLLAIVCGVVFTSESVSAGLNASVRTYLNVSNTNPRAYDVSVTPASLTLTAGGTATVVCNASVYDWNGWEDIFFANASLYSLDHSSIGDDDHGNIHYTNTSCGSCQQLDGTEYNASCACSFAVQYYAINGTWNCNITITDGRMFNLTPQAVNLTTSANGTVEVLDLIAIGIEQQELSFGNLSVTQTSASAESLNFTNYGNRFINVSMNTYGGSNVTNLRESNVSMACEEGNITNQYLRFGFSGDTTYDNMFVAANYTEPTGMRIIDITQLNYSIPIRRWDATDALGNSTNETFWRMSVPLDVGGLCNGTLVAYASEHDPKDGDIY